MQKNVTGQKIAVFAFDYSTGAPMTGDAGNITVYVDIDWGGLNALTDTSASEISSTNAPGWYLFDLTQAETNGNTLLFTGKSGTSNVAIVGTQIQTVPANFSLTSIDGSGRLDVIKINSVSASSVTTISANVGTTQPVNFTGTGGSALAKADMVDIAGAAVSTSSAQIGANIVLGAESYASPGVAPTFTQAVYMVLGLLGNFAFGGTTQTVKKIDATTTAMTYTIDSATAPTSHTRAT